MKAAKIVKKLDMRLNNANILQGVNWNGFAHIYKRKVVTKMHKVLVGTCSLNEETC